MVVAENASIFTSRAFRQYFVGQSLSLLGDGLRTLAVPLLAYHITHSALSTGTALICEFAPFSLFALVGGSLADRLDRRRIMIGADLIRFGVMAFFAVAYAGHMLTLPMIYGGLVVISICAAAFLGGQSPSIPYLLGRERTTEAMAALIGAQNATSLVTPVIGGALFAYFGPLPALTINALTYLASTLSLARIGSLGPDVRTGIPSIRHVADDVVLACRHFWSDVGMRTQAMIGFALNALGFGAFAILIPFLKRDFSASDQAVGAFLGITAIGAIAGAAFSVRNARRWPFGRAITVAYLLDAALFIPIVFTSNLWIAASFWACSNAVASFEISQILGFRLRVTPDDYVGRVMGAVRLFVMSGMAPGVLVLGWIADHATPRAAMTIAAFAFVVVAVIANLVPSIRNESR
jgi:MFS family permease